MPPPGFPRALRTDALALAALALVHLVFFHGILFGGETLYYDDFARYQLPLRALVADAYGELRLPLWNPYVWLGTPLAANPAAGAFYPPNWMLLALDDVRALNLSVALHLYLGGVFTYVLARDRAGSGAAPFAAAVGFSLGGIALSHTANPFYLFSLAWLPLALLAFRRALTARTLRYGALAGVALALMVLAGDVQLPLVAAVVLGLVAVARVGLAPAGTRRAGALRAAAALALTGAVGLGLAAVQLLPTLELAGLSERAAGLTAPVRQHFSFHPARAATLILPYLFGAPLPENSYWGFQLGDGPRFWFLSIYSGAVLLVLAAAAVRRGDPWPLALIASFIALGALALGRHGPFYEPAAQAIPGLDQFRYPEKFLAPLAVLVPVLGAEGLARLGREEARGRTLVALLVLAAAGAAAWALEPWLHSAFADRFPVPFLAETAAARVSGDGRNLLAFAAGGAVLLFAARRGWLAPAAVVVALAAFAAADVIVAGARLRWTAPAGTLAKTGTLASRLQGEGQAPPRLLRLPALDQVPLHRTLAQWHRVEAHLRETLAPNHHVRARISALLGYGAGSPGEVQAVFAGFDDREAPALARVLAAPWLLSARGTREGLPEPELSRPGALPRVRLTGAEPQEETLRRARALVLATRGSGARALVEAGHALRGGDVLPAAEARALAARLPASGAGHAAISAYRSEEVVVDVVAEQPSTLVLAEAFFPGWRAFVDDDEVAVHRADFLSRAVAVPAGAHRVVFRFEAPAVGLGAQLSAATAAVLLLMAMGLWWRRRSRESNPQGRG